jgi:hypothetical protein
MDCRKWSVSGLEAFSTGVLADGLSSGGLIGLISVRGFDRGCCSVDEMSARVMLCGKRCIRVFQLHWNCWRDSQFLDGYRDSGGGISYLPVRLVFFR